MAERKWADFELDEEGLDDAELLSVVPSGFETKPDAQGIKTVTNYTQAPNGTTIKIVKRVKVIRRRQRINKAVYERKQMCRFGLEADEADQSTKAATIESHEDIFIEVPKSRKKFGAGFDEQDQEENLLWGLTLPKPSMDLRQKFKALRSSEDGLDEDDLKTTKAGGRVVRLNQYKDMYSSREGDQKRRDENTVRVTNLSEDVKEEDLSELFGKFGKIDRIYLAKHKEKKCAKGFAFITYHSHEDALKAIRQLHRHGYDNLLLYVEWAKPSNKDGK